MTCAVLGLGATVLRNRTPASRCCDRFNPRFRAACTCGVFRCLASLDIMAHMEKELHRPEGVQQEPTHQTSNRSFQ